jgi:hypothetical protein
MIRWSAQEAGAHLRWRDYEAMRERGPSDGVVAEATRTVQSTATGLHRIRSGNYFESIGPRVALGRARRG